MENDKFQELELWMIVAFYMENAKENRFQLKDIISNLDFQIKYKYPKFNNYTEAKIKNIICNDVLKLHSDKGYTPPFIFTKISHNWVLKTEKWELWKKNNPNKYELYKEFIDFCNDSDLKLNLQAEEIKITNKTQSLSDRDQKINKEFFTKIKEELKENILKQCKENNIYLLGQLVFNSQEYNLLCKYARYCVHKKIYAIQEDIVLWTAFVKIIQEKAENTLAPWKTIYRELNFQTASYKQERFIYNKREDTFQRTLLHYNREKNLDLYYANENNRNLIIAHAFILKKQIHEYCSLFTENRNLTLDNLIKLINKSNLSRYSKNIVNNSSEEQLECLLRKQLEFIQNKNTNLCNIDYFTNKIRLYMLTPDKYETRQNYILSPSKKDSPPYLILDKNNDILIHIPTQSIEKEVNISIVFSNNKKIEKNAYLYNDSTDVKLDKSYIKHIFEDIKINFNGHHRYTILGKQYRLFENNGREKPNIASIERNPAILFTQKNIEVKNSNFIKEEVNTEYKQYLISLKDRSKHIEINGTLFYLDTIKKSDLNLELTKIDYIKSMSDVEYSLSLPKIIIHGEDDMTIAKLIITKPSTTEYVEIPFEYANKIMSESDESVIYIFDMADFEISNFFEKNNLYEIEYNYKNKKLIKEFVFIDNINIKFEKELYLKEKEINFTIDSPYETDSAYLVSKENNTSHYCYKFIDTQNNYTDRPVKFEIPLYNGKTYSLQVDFPIVSLKLVRNIDNILILKEDYIYERDLEMDFGLNLPDSIELTDTPALIVDGEICYFRSNHGKYTLGKNTVLKINNDKPYKKNVKLYIQTQNNEYKINIGKIFNRPEGYINVYKNENDGINIETNYENLNGFPAIKIQISNIEDFDDWELELPSERLEILKHQLIENKTYTITTYTDKYTKNIIDEIEYTYIPNNKIYKKYLKINSVLTIDNIERDVAYYAINDIKYLDKDLYKGQVIYYNNILSYKLLCELYFKISKHENKYTIIPDGEYKLSYVRNENGEKWILTSSNSVKSNILKLICK